MYDYKIKSYLGGRKITQLSRYPIITGRSPDLSFIGFKQNNLFSCPQYKINNSVEESQKRSFRRTKQNIYDLAFNHPWKYFVTLTFNSLMVDRLDYAAVSKKLSKWLNNIKSRKYPSMEYLIVPELHEKGGVHFHGLFTIDEEMNLVDSGHKDKKGRVIYNWFDFGLGFTTVTVVGDIHKASTYITKYITKDLTTTFKGKKYWHSHGIPPPKVLKIKLNSVYTKKKIIQTLSESVDFQSQHFVEVDTKFFKNDFKYIVTQDDDKVQNILHDVEKLKFNYNRKHNYIKGIFQKKIMLTDITLL